MDFSCSSSTRPDPREPNELPRKVNDHVYELYTPKEGPKAVKLEIIFFHGLYFGSTSEEAYLTTWTNDDNVLWPKTWLADEFPQARILSVSYDASMKQTAKTGRQDLYMIAENLTYDIGEAEVGQSPGSPVILVGHCFGGLVIKQLCVQAARRCYVNKDEKMRKFLDNLGGVFFYATPHRGSSFPEFLSKLLGGLLLEYVKSLNKHAARLDGDFLAVCRNVDLKPVRMASVGEKNKTKILGKFDAVIVPEGSSRYENYLYTLDADHISICKPKSKTSNSFKLLSTFIQGVKFEKKLVIDPDNLQISTSKKSVGLDMKVEIIRERLEKAKIVGIVGMGGIGKTTLAMAAFNNFCQFFDFTCFVHEVKDISGGFEAVKEKVSQHMCFKGRKISGIKSSRMNSSDMDWKGKQLLLVLDDIRNSHDTEVLSSLVHQAGLNSWFLVTCRDKSLLKEVQDISTYEMPGLTQLDAEKLFMSYASADQAKLPEDLNALAEKMVKKCDGLPLTLEIIGKCLMGNNKKKFWVQMHDALQEADNISLGNYEKLWSKLRLSFDNLKYKEQQMFMDATTFFSNAKGMDFRRRGNSNEWLFPIKEYDGWHWKLSDAKAAWGVIYGKEEIRWQTLVDASLVYDVRDDEPIRIHEQLKSLGRKIANDDKRKRVWNAYEGRELLLDGLSDYQGIHSLRVTFSWRESSSPRESERKREEEILEQSCFNLKAVKYFENDYRYPPHVAACSFGASKSPVTFPADLIVLCSPTLTFGEATIDFTHRKPQMAVLILTDYSETILPRSLVRLSSLKIFNLLAENLQELPDSFEKLQALEWFTIRSSALSALPASFGNLRALKVLSILHCDILGNLSDGFGNLLALEELTIESCGSLNTLPASFGNLGALERLTIEYCDALSSLSDDFGNLLALEELHIRSCKSLKTLPASFGNLLVLEKLDIDYCRGLQTLPASFGNLRALKRLSIVGCKVLGSLSDDFGNLLALEKLHLQRVGGLKTLPASFGNLRALKTLMIMECDVLNSLSDDFGSLPALEELDIWNCDGLRTLPASFGNLRALKKCFYECSGLQTLPASFGNLPALTSLVLWYCYGLRTLPASFGNLPALTDLDITHCDGLRTLPANFGNLRALKVLSIDGCEVLSSLSETTQDFGNLPALEHLDIRDCAGLETLPASFGNLRALKKLDILRCPVLTTLPDGFGNLRTLKELIIKKCDALASLSDDFENLLLLEKLEILQCPELNTLPYSFGNLRALKTLIIKNCDVPYARISLGLDLN